MKRDNPVGSEFFPREKAAKMGTDTDPKPRRFPGLIFRPFFAGNLQLSFATCKVTLQIALGSGNPALNIGLITGVCAGGSLARFMQWENGCSGRLFDS
jgi:hypothetical protein